MKLLFYAASAVMFLMVSCSKENNRPDKEGTEILTEDFLQYTDDARSITRLWDVEDVKRTIVDASGKEEVYFVYNRLNVTDFPMMLPHHISFGSVPDEPDNDERKSYLIIARSVYNTTEAVESPLVQVMPELGNWKLSPDGKKLTINKSWFFPEYDGPTGTFDLVLKRSDKMEYEDGTVIYGYSSLEGKRTSDLGNGEKVIDYFRIVSAPYSPTF